MLEQVIIFLVGLVVGVVATLITYKIRTGSASPVKLKQEMTDYQDKVEAHFEETSKKFKQMTTHYQDLYQHLSSGATSLCRPENIAPGLVSDTSPLSPTVALEQKTKNTDSNNSAGKPVTVKNTKESATSKIASNTMANKANTPQNLQQTQTAQKDFKPKPKSVGVTVEKEKPDAKTTRKI